MKLEKTHKKDGRPKTIKITKKDKFNHKISPGHSDESIALTSRIKPKHKSIEKKTSRKQKPLPKFPNRSKDKSIHRKKTKKSGKKKEMEDSFKIDKRKKKIDMGMYSDTGITKKEPKAKKSKTKTRKTNKVVDLSKWKSKKNKKEKSSTKQKKKPFRY